MLLLLPSMDDVIDRYRSEVIIDGITLGAPIAQVRVLSYCKWWAINIPKLLVCVIKSL